MADAARLPAHTARLLARLRERPVRVHAITNAAAQVLTANLLLAAGAIPSLTHAADEVEAFAARADALLVNLGTLDPERREAMPRAIAAAKRAGRVVVLDPVKVDASPPRRDFARALLEKRPDILRCNAGEFAALFGREPDDEALAEIARATGAMVALTGEIDRITDGARFFRIANGHPMMTRTTAMGCAGTALVAALSAIEPDRALAAACALLAIGVAGEIAAQTAPGIGTYPLHVLDALDALDAGSLEERGRVV